MVIDINSWCTLEKPRAHAYKVKMSHRQPIKVAAAVVDVLAAAAAADRHGRSKDQETASETDECERCSYELIIVGWQDSRHCPT